MALKIPVKTAIDVTRLKRGQKDIPSSTWDYLQRMVKELRPHSGTGMGCGSFLYVPQDRRRGTKFSLTAQCHSGLVALGYAEDSGQEGFKPAFLAIGFVNHTRAVYDEAVEAYRQWIFSSISPWRTLLTSDSCWIDADMKGCGIFVLGERAMAKSHRIIRNFAIAMRMGGEKPYIIQVWYDLVKHGVDPAEALCLCMYLNYAFGKTDLIHVSQYEASCDHWPISESTVDWNRFARGQVNLESEDWGLNNIWKNPQFRAYKIKKKLFEDFSGSCPVRERRSSGLGNGVAYYHPEDIAKWYLKVRPKYGIKSVRRRKVSSD